MSAPDVIVTLTYSPDEARRVISDLHYFDSNVTALYDQHDRMNLIRSAVQRALAEATKPEEPTGLGAVVEDAEGNKYVRAGITHDGAMEDCWRHVTGRNIGYWSRWSELDVVRVLSEGVPS